jgi:hypothetical protein
MSGPQDGWLLLGINAETLVNSKKQNIKKSSKRKPEDPAKTHFS